MRRYLRRAVIGAATLALAAGSAACGEAGDGSDEGDGAGDGGAEGFRTIGLLLPDNTTTRYEAFDRPVIEATIAELCDDCEVTHGNADADTARQKQQFDAMLTQGVDVIILDPVDAAATGPWVEDAAAEGVPVVAYDRLAEGDIDAYVSYDNEAVGRLQGQALLDALGNDAEGARVMMINGSPTDPDAALFKAGAREVLDPVVEIVYERDIDGWDPAIADDAVTSAVRSLGTDGFDAVHSANDGLTAGIVNALRGAGVEDVPVGGQDAELAALQRIISGEQTFTIYKALIPAAEIAAEIAVRLLDGEDFSDLTPDSVDSPTTDGVPSALLTPVAVTVDNIEETVIADGFHTTDEICTAEFADECAEAGIGG
ncbi:sugar ABC transporter substrate-binding protein [Streptomyces sp. ST2-7A]|uniref:sugar ABC transporter substrate-binding protein n=1 Tax=Streptomyces sp. ST2-7A TaxID=2907214 RepID=UPI001F347F81|nr:substrate-binding domain-containing protein [Streptomyces sp. ST2-7A]MCE7082646.1 substrate-binding domain-containing protein [Streptomyces sp. ST2-7A]